MIRKMFVMIMVLSFAVLAGCGGGDAPRQFTGQVPRDQANDADIARSSAGDLITPAATNRNVLFGVSPGTEYRAFLDFPLDGSSGGSIIPANARIVSADLEVFVNSVNVTTPIPTLLDLVTYSLAIGPVSADFASQPIAFRSLTFIPSDQGNFVRIDVTSLVAAALVNRLPDVQFRFLYDFVSNANGLVEIADGVSATAPLLTITYE